jgi:hypothetical protein
MGRTPVGLSGLDAELLANAAQIGSRISVSYDHAESTQAVDCR